MEPGAEGLIFFSAPAQQSVIAFHLQVKISLKNHESYNFGKADSIMRRKPERERKRARRSIMRTGSSLACFRATFGRRCYTRKMIIFCEVARKIKEKSSNS